MSPFCVRVAGGEDKKMRKERFETLRIPELKLRPDSYYENFAKRTGNDSIRQVFSVEKTGDGAAYLEYLPGMECLKKRFYYFLQPSMEQMYLLSLMLR